MTTFSLTKKSVAPLHIMVPFPHSPVSRTPRTLKILKLNDVKTPSVVRGGLKLQSRTCLFESVRVNVLGDVVVIATLHRQFFQLWLISFYENGSSIVTNFIPAGGEIFKNYGDEWLLARPEYVEQQLPLVSDYVQVQQFLDRFSRSIESLYRYQ